MPRRGSQRKSAFKRMLEQNRQVGIDRDRANEAASNASGWGAPDWTTSTPEPWSPAKLLSIEDLQNWMMETPDFSTKSVDELTREAVSLNDRILKARSTLPFKDWKPIEKLEQKRDQILDAIRELDPTRDFTEESLAFSAHKFHANYYKFSAAAARGENVPDNELVMTVSIEMPSHYFVAFSCSALTSEWARPNRFPSTQRTPTSSSRVLSSSAEAGFARCCATQPLLP